MGTLLLLRGWRLLWGWGLLRKLAASLGAFALTLAAPLPSSWIMPLQTT
jgi:hypothetical protein